MGKKNYWTFETIRVLSILMACELTSYTFVTYHPTHRLDYTLFAAIYLLGSMPYAVLFQLFKMKKCCKLAMNAVSEHYRIWKKQRELEKAME